MQILEEVKDCRTIGISGHENPDGDCAGSCLGLALYLRKMMPEARVDVFLEPLREDLYNNLPGADTVITNFRTDVGSYDAFVVLDSAKDRISGAEELFDQAKITINIDHHISNKGHTVVVITCESPSGWYDQFAFSIYVSPFHHTNINSSQTFEEI